MALEQTIIGFPAMRDIAEYALGTRSCFCWS
jgi:hypothetical protein